MTIRRRSGCTSIRAKATLADAPISCGANRSRFFQAEDGSNSRMIQRSEQLRLAFESRHTLRVRGKRGWQHLDRDVAAEAGIGSAIDFAHPASQRAGKGEVAGRVGAFSERWLRGSESMLVSFACPA
jgi:hypothetical protein